MKTKEFSFVYLDYLSLKNQNPKPHDTRVNFRIYGIGL